MQKFSLQLMNTNYLVHNVHHYMWTDILIYQHYMHWQYGILHVPTTSGSQPQPIMDCSTGQAFNCQPLTSAGQVQSQANICGVYGGYTCQLQCMP
jgi:hypothetical protein